MGDAISISLDKLPPSVNRIWRSAGNGRVYTAPAYAAWKAEAGWQIKAQVGGRRVPGPYELTLDAVRPDRRRRDLGNIEKATSDLLVALNIIDDDSLCEALAMRWVPEGPAVSITITPKQGGTHDIR